jgi:hypothetical protein
MVRIPRIKLVMECVLSGTAMVSSFEFMGWRLLK